VLKRLLQSSRSAGKVQPGIAGQAVSDWMAWVKAEDEARIQKAAGLLQGPRGLAYTGFLLCAQSRLCDWNLVSIVGSLPPGIPLVVGPELIDALDSPRLERRLRQLAQATLKVMETYYKPLVQIIWTLAARMVGKSAAMPTMCGQLMAQCREMSSKLTDVIPIADFLDWEALEVRNGAAHPTALHFDVKTSELVVRRNGPELRLREDALRARLYGLFLRAHTMHLAVLWVSGNLEGRVMALPPADAGTAPP